jgi:hypothetical protein
MGRGAQRKYLNQRDAQDHARLGVVRQLLARGAVDQRVEIGQMAQRFRHNRVDKGAVGRGQALGGAMKGQFQRVAPAQHGIEQA